MQSLIDAELENLDIITLETINSFILKVENYQQQIKFFFEKISESGLETDEMALEYYNFFCQVEWMIRVAKITQAKLSLKVNEHIHQFFGKILVHGQHLITQNADYLLTFLNFIQDIPLNEISKYMISNTLFKDSEFSFNKKNYLAKITELFLLTDNAKANNSTKLIPQELQNAFYQGKINKETFAAELSKNFENLLPENLFYKEQEINFLFNAENILKELTSYKGELISSITDIFVEAYMPHTLDSEQWIQRPAIQQNENFLSHIGAYSSIMHNIVKVEYPEDYLEVIYNALQAFSSLFARLQNPILVKYATHNNLIFNSLNNHFTTIHATYDLLKKITTDISKHHSKKRKFNRKKERKMEELKLHCKDYFNLFLLHTDILIHQVLPFTIKKGATSSFNFIDKENRAVHLGLAKTTNYINNLTEEIIFLMEKNTPYFSKIIHSKKNSFGRKNPNQKERYEKIMKELKSISLHSYEKLLEQQKLKARESYLKIIEELKETKEKEILEKESREAQDLKKFKPEAPTFFTKNLLPYIFNNKLLLEGNESEHNYAKEFTEKMSPYDILVDNLQEIYSSVEDYSKIDKDKLKLIEKTILEIIKITKESNEPYLFNLANFNLAEFYRIKAMNVTVPTTVKDNIKEKLLFINSIEEKITFLKRAEVPLKNIEKNIKQEKLITTIASAEFLCTLVNTELSLIKKMLSLCQHKLEMFLLTAEKQRRAALERRAQRFFTSSPLEKKPSTHNALRKKANSLMLKSFEIVKEASKVTESLNQTITQMEKSHFIPPLVISIFKEIKKTNNILLCGSTPFLYFLKEIKPSSNLKPLDYDFITDIPIFKLNKIIEKYGNGICYQSQYIENLFSYKSKAIKGKSTFLDFNIVPESTFEDLKANAEKRSISALSMFMDLSDNQFKIIDFLEAKKDIEENVLRFLSPPTPIQVLKAWKTSLVYEIIPNEQASLYMKDKKRIESIPEYALKGVTKKLTVNQKKVLEQNIQIAKKKSRAITVK